MNFRQQKDRYYNDPLFHSIVNMIGHFLEQGTLTVGELRDAATYAGILFEYRNMGRYRFMIPFQEVPGYKQIPKP